MPRLFTALEIPAQAGQWLSMLRGGLPGARWIDPEHYHLTLRFIGDIDDALAREIAFMLADVRRLSFDLRLDGVSSFGGRRPRAVVATVAPTPHVTLARLRDASSHDVADYLATRHPFRPEPFRVPRFVLYSSRASVGGGPYVVEAAYPLAA